MQKMELISCNGTFWRLKTEASIWSRMSMFILNLLDLLIFCCLKGFRDGKIMASEDLHSNGHYIALASLPPSLPNQDALRVRSVTSSPL